MKNEIPNMKRDKYMSWDTYFMSVAVLSTFRSKDKNTQNGACIADNDKKIIGIGYNGLPRGLSDNTEQYWLDDDNDMENSRHTYIIHAERNAILNSNLQTLKNSTLYTTQYPCNICAQTIIQVGIKKVIYLFKKEHKEEHVKRNKIVLKMFGEAKVELIDFNDLNIEDKSFIKKLIDLNKEEY